ncbi:MAG: hypothetical protein PHY28_10565 [Dehalococcoidales bacterium]|nr:hypothetical protein [Dehalococcoidales bacterium]
MKKLPLVIVATLSILGLMILLAGCSSPTKIGDILANPTEFEGKQVTVKGYVGDTIWLGVLKKGGYQIGDDSGTIWVVTEEPPPQKGVKISTKGDVSPAFELGDMALGTVINETERGS